MMLIVEMVHSNQYLCILNFRKSGSFALKNLIDILLMEKKLGRYIKR